MNKEAHGRWQRKYAQKKRGREDESIAFKDYRHKLKNTNNVFK
jgi:hypothetical protein